MSPLDRTIRAAVATACLALAGGPAVAADAPIVGLITKTGTNPFFVKMREGAKARAGELGVEPCNRDPDVAAGLAVWRPVAERPEEVIDVGLPFLREHAAAAGLPL